MSLEVRKERSESIGMESKAVGLNETTDRTSRDREEDGHGPTVGTQRRKVREKEGLAKHTESDAPGR